MAKNNILSQINGWSWQQKFFGGGVLLVFLVFASVLMNRHQKPESQGILGPSLPSSLPPTVVSENRPEPISDFPASREVAHGNEAVLPMKVFQNEYLGFSFRMPEGWLIDVDRGRILVCRDDIKSACMMIAPRRLREGRDIRTFLETEFQAQQKVYAGFRAQFTIGDLKEGAGRVEGKLAGAISGLRIQGGVRAYTTEGGAFYDSIWAPQEEWGNLSPTLLLVRDSFKSFQARSMNLFEGQVFTVSYPENWRVNEALNGIKVVSPDDENGFSVAINVYLPGNPTPQEYLKLFEQDKTRITNLQVLSEKAYPHFIDKIGQRWQVVEREVVFDSSVYGRQRGIMNGAVVSQGNNFSGIATMRCSSITKWDELKATLAQIEGSFRITKPDRLGGGPNAVKMPNRLDLPGYESLPIPGTQMEWWDRG